MSLKRAAEEVEEVAAKKGRVEDEEKVKNVEEVEDEETVEEDVEDDDDIDEEELDDDDEEDDEMLDEDTEFCAEDFEGIEVSGEDLAKFNTAYNEFTIELSDRADEDEEPLHALILGRAQDLRPIPLTLEEFQQRLPAILITEQTKELRDEIDADLDVDGDLLTVLERCTEICQELKSQSKYCGLVQYLTVLTDAVFDPDYENLIAVAAHDEDDDALKKTVSLLNGLPDLWIDAMQTATELDQTVRENLLKFLATLPKKASRLKCDVALFEKMVNTIK